MRRTLLVAALLLVALAALVRGRGPAPVSPSSTRPAVAPPTPAAAPAEPAPRDPARIRDVFRFADIQPERFEERESRPAGRDEASPTPSPHPVGPRLVGLVRRAGRLLAAFSDSGEVVLAAPGDRVAGITVIAVSEDAVRVRRGDGSEANLPLD